MQSVPSEQRPAQFKKNLFLYAALWWYTGGFFLTLFSDYSPFSGYGNRIYISKFLTPKGFFVLGIMLGAISLLCVSVVRDRLRLFAFALLTLMLLHAKQMSIFLLASRTFAFQASSATLWGYIPLVTLPVFLLFGKLSQQDVETLIPQGRSLIQEGHSLIQEGHSLMRELGTISFYHWVQGLTWIFTTSTLFSFFVGSTGRLLFFLGPTEGDWIVSWFYVSFAIGLLLSLMRVVWKREGWLALSVYLVVIPGLVAVSISALSRMF